MWCPKCKEEYREGFTSCAKCDVDLMPELPPEPHEEPGPVAANRTEKFVTVANLINIIDVDLARAKLEADGIEVFTLDESTVSANWLFSNAIGGVKLQVREEDAERAREILAQKPVPEDGSEKEGPVCPKCGSSELGYEVFSRKFAFLSWLLTGIPLPFLKKRWACKKCGYSWK